MRKKNRPSSYSEREHELLAGFTLSLLKWELIVAHNGQEPDYDEGDGLFRQLEEDGGWCGLCWAHGTKVGSNEEPYDCDFCPLFDGIGFDQCCCIEFDDWAGNGLRIRELAEKMYNRVLKEADRYVEKLGGKK